MGTKQKHCDQAQEPLINSSAKPKHTACSKVMRIMGFEAANGMHYTLPSWWFCEGCCHVIFMKVEQVTYP